MFPPKFMKPFLKEMNSYHPTVSTWIEEYNGSCILLESEDGRLVAALLYTQMDKEVTVDSLFVLEGERHQGYGLLLVSYLHNILISLKPYLFSVYFPPSLKSFFKKVGRLESVRDFQLSDTRLSYTLQYVNEELS